MRSVVVVSVLLLGLGVAGAQDRGAFEGDRSGIPGTSPTVAGELEFGFGLQVSRPYPRPGATLGATLFFFNRTNQDADGTFVNPGGFGCRYFLTIRDQKGRVVWNPRVPCPARDERLAPVGPFPFPAGSFLQLPVDVRLVHTFSEAGDPDGTPLPGGPYVLEGWHEYNGPAHPEGLFEAPPGSSPRASVPFRIVECGEPAGDLAVRELGQGEISGYRYGDPDFTGEDLVLRTEAAALEFWGRHTSNRTPVPAPPAVDFSREMVVVTLLGTQTSGGGPATRIDRVEERACHIRVSVTDFRVPGPLDVITNPFHAVAVPKSQKEVVFQHHTVLP